MDSMILYFSQRSGYATVRYLGKYKEFDLYKPLYEDPDMATGLPVYIVVKDNKPKYVRGVEDGRRTVCERELPAARIPEEHRIHAPGIPQPYPLQAGHGAARGSGNKRFAGRGSGWFRFIGALFPCVQKRSGLYADGVQTGYPDRYAKKAIIRQ